VGGVLGLAVVEVEFEMLNVLGVGEVQVHARTHCADAVLLELRNVVSEVVPADPDLS
jgi:hypothetical protein